MEPVLDLEPWVIENGDAAPLQFLKARAFVGLDLVKQQMLTYTAEDLVVVHLVSKLGARHTENGTRKDFALVSFCSRRSHLRSRPACSRTWRRRTCT